MACAGLLVLLLVACAGLLVLLLVNMEGLSGCPEACFFLLFPPAFALPLSFFFSLDLEASDCAVASLEVATGYSIESASGWLEPLADLHKNLL